MPVNKERGQQDRNLRVCFSLLDTGGSPSITDVNPPSAANDISVADTAQGRATVTIKNFKGVSGAYCIHATSKTTSVWTSVVGDSYSGNDLTFELSSENDASTLTDTSIYVSAEAY